MKMKYQRILSVNFVLLLIASTILVFSSIILDKRFHMTKLTFLCPYYFWTPTIMLWLGLFTFFTTCYGLITSALEARLPLIGFCVLLSLSCLGQLGSCFTALQLRNTIGNNADSRELEKISANMKQYFTDPAVREDWDVMQKSLRCCGGLHYGFPEQSGRGFMTWVVPMTNAQNKRDLDEGQERVKGTSRDVPDSCCHPLTVNTVSALEGVAQKGCGCLVKNDNGTCIAHDADEHEQINILTEKLKEKIWLHGCIEILKSMMRSELVETGTAWVYISLGLLLALLELVTVALAAAFVAQINRKAKMEGKA